MIVFVGLVRRISLGLLRNSMAAGLYVCILAMESRGIMARRKAINVLNLVAKCLVVRKDVWGYVIVQHDRALHSCLAAVTCRVIAVNEI